MLMFFMIHFPSFHISVFGQICIASAWFLIEMKLVSAIGFFSLSNRLNQSSQSVNAFHNLCSL